MLVAHAADRHERIWRSRATDSVLAVVQVYFPQILIAAMFARDDCLSHAERCPSSNICAPPTRSQLIRSIDSVKLSLNFNINLTGNG